MFSYTSWLVVRAVFNVSTVVADKDSLSILLSLCVIATNPAEVRKVYALDRKLGTFLAQSS